MGSLFANNQCFVLPRGLVFMQLLMLFLFLLSSSCMAYTPDNTYAILGQENLASMAHQTSENEHEDCPTGKNFSQVLENTLYEHTHLPKKTKRKLMFKLFAEHEETLQHSLIKPVLDGTSRQDLNLICGPKSDVSFYIAAHIDRTQTEAGSVTLIKRLCSPTDHIATLRKHQAIIKELTHNRKLFDALSNQLAAMHTDESAILSLWNEDLFYNLLKQEELFIPKAEKLSAWINNSTFLIDINSYTRVISLVTNNLMLAAGATLLPALGVATYYNKEATAKALEACIEPIGAKSVCKMSVPGLALLALHWWYKSESNPATGLDSAANIIGGPAGATSIFYAGDALRNIVSFRKCLQKKIMYISSYIKLVKDIGALTQKNEVLQEHLPLIANLEDELKKLETSSQDVKRLFALLDTSTFKGKEASFFSSYGNIYVTYNLLHKIKTALVPAMVCIGELDAYVSCAQLLLETQGHAAGYCLPTFIEGESTPHVQATNFWNPSIPYQIAATNSVELGGSQPAHIIVTGANAGGKSTTMKGLTLTIICAQSLGIACAESLNFTPFSCICTYLNITDDIAAGKSHFRAGAARARELISYVEETAPKGFSLTAVDEVFNGTTFEEGQAAAYFLIEKLGSYKHNMCITVTHFPAVPLLAAKTGTFANYKVSVSYKPDGSLARSYKLEPGISEQKIALHILKEEGFDATFLQKAQQFLLPK